MKRISKKIGALVSAIVLALAMSITAFAAPSAVAGVTSKTASVDVSSATQTPSLTDQSVKSILVAAGIDTSKASIVSTFELTGTPDNGTVQLDVPTTLVPEGSKVIALHFVNGAWKVETSSYKDGVLTISGLSELSPFALVVDKTTASTGTTVSPKTGETGVTVAVVVFAFATFAAVLTLKKERSF